MIRTRLLFTALLTVSLTGPDLASAEPMFLSKQYTRCSSCHFSPTGGGLLTPYGRSLSREELSTTGRTSSNEREHEFLYGALGSAPTRLSLGLGLRPARLSLDFDGGSFDRNFLMNADVTAAFRSGEWTAYVEAGRQGRTGSPAYKSFEHWVSYQKQHGLGVRVGRFLPAYGVRLADHSAFSRTPLGFNTADQVYAVEISHVSDKRLIQLSIGPGRADSVTEDDGGRAMTASGRVQFDLSPTRSLVLSGLLRRKADFAAGEKLTGVAFGIAPARRLSIWTEANARFVDGISGAGYVVANETSLEVYRGLWVKFTPQLRTTPGDSGGGTWRTAFALDLLPRTHWNLGLSYYRDKDRRSNRVTKTLLAQLFLYL